MKLHKHCSIKILTASGFTYEAGRTAAIENPQQGYIHKTYFLLLSHL